MNQNQINSLMSQKYDHDDDRRQVVEALQTRIRKAVTTDREPFIKEIKKQMYPEKKPSKYDYIIFFLVVIILGLLAWMG